MKNEIMKNPTLITHYDLDGAVSEIVLSRFINFNKKRACGYGKFTKYINDLKENEEVIFSDVSLDITQMESLISKTHNFIIIDHHPATEDLIINFPEFSDKIFFNREICGAVMCKFFVRDHYCDQFYFDWTPHLDELVDIVDVYDLWKTSDKLWPKAYNLNILYWHHSHYNFVKIFQNGYAITPEDSSIIKSELKKKSKFLQDAEKYEVGNTLFVICSREICNDFTLIYGTKYDMYFMVSADEKTGSVDISLRTALSYGDFTPCYKHIKKQFPDLIISVGGHAKAGGITLQRGIKLDDITKICEEFSSFFSDSLIPF